MVRKITCSLVFLFTLFGSPALADGVRRVVTSVDDDNKATVLFDSVVPLQSGPFGIASTNLWITDSYPPSLTKEDPATRPIGVSPPDNGTKFRIVEFPPLDPATEAQMPAEMIMKGVNHPPAAALLPTNLYRQPVCHFQTILAAEVGAR
jgi:hypothetical protein